MTRTVQTAFLTLLAVATALLVAAPSVYPTGTTIYDPAKAWNGYTVLSPLGTQAAIVIDMNGKIVKQWDGFNTAAGGPNRILPGGVVMGPAGTNGGKQESTELIERDFEGKELWRFDHNEEIDSTDGKSKGKRWSTRQHHDWQRADFPSGYYSPNATPSTEPVTTLLLTHTDLEQAKVAPGTLEDDRIIEVSKDGKITWEWIASQHVDEMKFDDVARKSLANAAGAGGRGGGYNWLHLNAATYVGPNHWFDEGDKRFAPDNVIISSREASIVAVVARDGKIVWQLGPDYSATPEMRGISQVIGQHHAHVIAKGLPGAGNVMIFDNGGASVYGPVSAVAPKGKGVFARPSSRVLEIDPVSLQLVWSYTAPNFFATNISGAQRLPNGNTLITEGPAGRLFEVTAEGETVWEYIYAAPPGAGKGGAPKAKGPGGPAAKGAPKAAAKGGVKAAPKGGGPSSVYRSYRLPYSWIPQLAASKQQAVKAPPATEFRVP